MTGSAAAGRLPRLFVAGAAKAGTTSLARWLDDHPAVSVTPRKELNYFSYDGVWQLGIEWYVAQFPGDATTLACDASPSYLPSREAPQRIREQVPDARIIALLRDPVERTYVHYWWTRSWGAEPREFLDVVRAELADGPTPLGCVDSSRYVDHLERYAACFPADQLMVVDFLALRDRPEATFQEVCRFAGIEQLVPESVGTAFNVSSNVRSQRLWAWLGRREGRRSWREHPRGVDRLLVRKAERPPMDPEARRLLTDYFAAYDDRLRAFWGREQLPWEQPAKS